MVNVLIFSPVRLFCEGLAACLAVYSEQMRVAATLSSSQLLTAAIRDNDPEIVLYDVTRPETLIDARRIIEQWPELPVIAVALPEEPVDVVRCAEAGFAAYVPPQSSASDLVAVIHASLAGDLICSPRVAAELMREIRRRPRQAGPATEPLTARERQILALIARGLCNKEIARELAVSVATVKNHVHNTFAKLKVGQRREAIQRLRSDPSVLEASGGLQSASGPQAA